MGSQHMQTFDCAKRGETYIDFRPMERDVGQVAQPEVSQMDGNGLALEIKLEIKKGEGNKVSAQ